mmetsp:Transcript_37550/g.60553  ORF Transcript_37550/g.60553 Transcript_37550/m.60553 type:complete len:82 (-) Transcript_37550:31-276(-)
MVMDGCGIVTSSLTRRRDRFRCIDLFRPLAVFIVKLPEMPNNSTHHAHPHARPLMQEEWRTLQDHQAHGAEFGRAELSSFA